MRLLCARSGGRGANAMPAVPVLFSLRCPLHSTRNARQSFRNHRSPVTRSSLSTTLSIGLGVASLLPLTLVVDGLVDQITDRVAQLTNADADGVSCYVSFPPNFDPSTSTHPVVVVIHQIFGIQQREVDLCDELAREGFVAVAPDTFGGRSAALIPRALLLAYEKALKPDADYGVPQVAAAVSWIKRQKWGASAKLAVSGFCYGGGSAIRFGVKHRQDVDCLTVFYGRPVESEEELARLTCPVLGIYGTEDRQFSADSIARLEQGLGSKGQILRFEGQGHAFVTNLEAIRSGGAPADAWKVFLQFLRQNLGVEDSVVV